MSTAVDARRELLEELRGHELVEDIDFTRDGFQTVILHLGDPSEGGVVDV
ncbi:hypothetical protein HWV23_02605 [Natronomonas halophila]|nr:hypothetical protein [Natronomonas halophila]QLD84591.1 hypothetical protein HWV23_02320 [Natronomonas halophila]QLD84647.1 hypothetical protein HWV23_02605 [Natronomonas halophila]